MTSKFTVTFENRTEEVQIECKPCSKDGLKYICSVSGGETFRMRKNAESAWVAKHEDCPEDPGLIGAIGEAYEKLRGSN